MCVIFTKKQNEMLVRIKLKASVLMRTLKSDASRYILLSMTQKPAILTPALLSQKALRIIGYYSSVINTVVGTVDQLN